MYYGLLFNRTIMYYQYKFYSIILTVSFNNINLSETFINGRPEQGYLTVKREIEENIKIIT